MASARVPSGTPKPYTRYRARHAPRAVLAAALSALLPGAGQLYAGRPWRGVAMLAAASLAAAAVAAVWSRGSVFVLGLLVRPDVLLALLAAVAVAFLLHTGAVLDAYAAARRAGGARGPGGPAAAARASALALVLAVLAVPYGVAAYYDVRSYDVLTTVFAEDDPIDPGPAFGPEAATSGGGEHPPAAAAPPSAALPPEPAPASAAPASEAPSEPGATVPPDPSAGPAAPATSGPAGGEEQQPEERAPSWHERARLNVLLLGGDAGPGRWGLRTDTMIVVSVSLKSGRAAVFSVPRNLQGVPFPPSAHTTLETFPDILNALWGYAERRPELFPGARRPGLTALKETVGNLLGLRIDYAAAVDLRGFVEVVDALGGVTVTVQRRVYDAGVSPPYEGEPWIVVDLQPGEHRLDGRLALGYVRTRWATSDYDRMQRQRCLVGALVEQASVGKLLRSFPKLASTVKEHVQTDIPIKVLPDLIELVAGLDPERMVGVSFAPPRFRTVADPEAMRAAVQAALRARPDGAAGVDLLAGSCA